MYEREAVVAAVRRLLDAASAGRGGAVFVVAAAGLGKTSVLQAAVAAAQDRFDVRVGAGDAVETALPYGLIGQVLGDEDEVAAPAVEARDLPAANRFYVILRRIRREAAKRPLLLAFDDLHWSDPDSLTLLHLLCRRAPALPLAVVATARRWPSPALGVAEQLAARGLAGIQRLPPLTDQAARHVLRDHFGAISRDLADRAVAACDGNPLLLELATQNLGADRPGPADGPADGPAPAEAARRMLLARFAAADTNAQRYVRAASVLGTRFRPSIAAAIADLTAAQAAGTVEELFGADLLRGDDGEWARFRHALVRQAIYDDLSPPARAYLHERAFRALLHAGVAAGEAAEHAIAARLVGDAQAIETLTAAGRTALRAGAVQAARRYLDAAVRLAGDAAPAVLQIDLAKALLAGGAGDAAATLLDRVLARPGLPAPIRLSAQLLLGQAAFHSGAVQRAGNLFDTVAAASARTDPELALNALLGHCMQSWARLGPRAALPVAVRARVLAADAGPAPRACAEAVWGYYAWLSGDPAGLHAAETATRSFAAGMAHWGIDPVATTADIAVWAERFSLAERLLADALRAAEDGAEPLLLLHTVLSSSDMLRQLGRLGEAIVMAERACDVAELLPVGLPLARATKGLALMETGRLSEAAACEDADVGPEWYLAVGYQLRLRATLAYRRGQLDIACTAFDLLEERTSQWGIADPSHIPYGPDAIAAYIAAGRVDDARRVVDRLASCQLPSQWPTAAAAAGRAALAMHDGDLKTAESSLAQAARLIRKIPMPLAQCRTLTAYGAILTRLGQREKARQLLTSALQQAQACGADWYAHQAMAEFRRAGGRAHRIPAGQLSPQEKAVARLARAGRTNREISRELFLSVNTVETHLSHIYRKLGINRRSELTGQDLN